MAERGTWEKYLEMLYNLRRDKRGSHERPHKPVLLLAILDLLDRGHLKGNTVRLDDVLVRTFRQYFEVVRKGDDKPTIENPFYFLSGDGFWSLASAPGERPPYQPGNASQVPSIGALRKTYGYFDEKLWSGLLESPFSRQQLRQALVGRYFPEHREQLAALTGGEDREEDLLIAAEAVPGRDAAFRHTILEIYDYRCAACGIRVKLNNGLSLVEAAHIIPFRVSRNDRPDNGLALCPNHHWAMDRHLIAPVPDQNQRAGIWQVNPDLDDRVDDQKDLIVLANRPVLRPTEEKFYPSHASLRWRQEHLVVRY